MIELAIIGGSGRYALEIETSKQQEHKIQTPFGEPSAAVDVVESCGVEIAFLPRHGREHQLPPHRVNYRANVWSLKSINCKAILALNAVGSIRPDWAPGTMVVPDQLIDYTWGREASFEDTDSLDSLHIDFGEPYDADWIEKILSAGNEAGLDIIRGGVHGITQGPRLETAAEVRRLARDGCDLVGMTGMPEAALAREAGIPYVCLAVVVNPAAGVGAVPITMDEVSACLEQTQAQTSVLITHLITALGSAQ